MTAKPKYYFNLDGNITDGEKEYSLYNIEDVVGDLSISSGLKERYVLYGRNSLLDLLNELHEENQILRKALKNTYYNEICEVCKYGKYERNWYGEGEFECLKKHFGNEDWKCDGLKECDDFELDIKRFLK